jgi:quaternary ammonium compound-resistance protein SugE
MQRLPWLYLLIAGLFEVGWPLGFKLSQVTRFRLPFILLAVISMSLSGLFLWLANGTSPSVRPMPCGRASAPPVPFSSASPVLAILWG